MKSKAVLIAAVMCMSATANAGQRAAQPRPSPTAVPPAARPVPVPSPSPTSTSTMTMRSGQRRSSPVPPLAFRSGFPILPFFWAGVPVYLDPVEPFVLEDGPTGGVQLDVQPWRSAVYVDGRFAGRVEEFSGYYQHLTVTAGPHRIVIVEDGYEPLVIDLNVPPGRTTTYRGTLTEVLNR